MIEVPCPACGQKTVQPDPPESVKSPRERIDFERSWDAAWMAWRDRRAAQ